MGSKNFRMRFLIGSMTIILLIFLIGRAHAPYMRTVQALVMALIAFVGTWEYTQFIQAKGFKPSARLICFFAPLIVISVTAMNFIHWPYLPLFVFFTAFFIFMLSHFNEGENSLVHSAVELFGVAYVALPLSMMYFILYPPANIFEAAQDGRFWLSYLLVVSKMVDVGGYFTGKAVGRNALCPSISPNKTWEGAIGGVSLGLVSSVGFWWLSKTYIGEAFQLSLCSAIVLGLGMSVLSLLGDLSESMFKRDAKVKDSNKLPGFGGVLDIIDSLLFTTPVLFFYMVIH